MIANCPGSDKFKQPKPENIKCNFCGKETEIWTDEFQTTCPNCHKRVTRAGATQSCLDWCKFAKECVGESIYNEYLKAKEKENTKGEGE